MPSTSAKQAKFMRAVAHSPKFAKKVGVSPSVGKDFEMADKKMKKFKGGGPLMESRRGPIDTYRGTLGSDKDIVDRGNRTPHERMPPAPKPEPRKPLGEMGKKGYKKGGEVMEKASGGQMSAAYRAKQMGVGQKAANPGLKRALARGPQVSGGPRMKEGGEVMKKSDKAGRALVRKSADTMGRAMKMNKGGKCYAGGGLVGGHKSADGIAKKGKTRGKMC